MEVNGDWNFKILRFNTGKPQLCWSFTRVEYTHTHANPYNYIESFEQSFLAHNLHANVCVCRCESVWASLFMAQSTMHISIIPNGVQFTLNFVDEYNNVLDRLNQIIKLKHSKPVNKMSGGSVSRFQDFIRNFRSGFVGACVGSLFSILCITFAVILKHFWFLRIV